MKTLSKLQNKFIDGVYGSDLAVLDLVKFDKIKKRDLLGIYQNNLYQNLRHALKLTFENIYDFLGEEKFSDIAQKFIKNNRSQSGNLDEYGEGFARFLKDHKNGEFLCDLAQIDWLKQASYLAKNDTEINLEELRKIDGENFLELKFELSASCFLFESEFSLFAKKSRHKKRQKPCFYLIHRIFNEVQIEKINKKEFLFLKNLKDKKTLFDSCKKSNCDVSVTLQKFIAKRVLVDYKI